ncbi:Protein of uncharacterised function (DUF2844) [Bordetella ansorpii]|uniref:Protein of uncharacterized function (DUF2844) n=1 Tax=Bordetella ansorpii TaxID=288768 RepID=A0A157M7P0_9BORD|nr:DUF2844 domain-containing protein [Bordetella ansorpii]SAI04830.1 Protein of uncharacterised function (DUF2844) [Bordetella ansorpii]
MAKWHYAALASIACAALPAHAELGGTPTWPAPQISTFQARALAATTTPFNVIQTLLPSGTTVREYVTPSGTVFGIVWDGPDMPPLNTLLGAYFPTYRQALDARRAARRGGAPGPVQVEEAGLTVQSGGHMGSFIGRAYLTDSIPSGVTAADIR